MAAAVVIRDLEGMEEARAAEELQHEVWGMTDRDILAALHLVSAKKAGGQLIGAFDGDLLVGFVFGFVGIEHGETSHHSHLLAVKPSHRNREIGFHLKLAQREAVLAQGIRHMSWTFDPLQSANAHLNFHKLAATCGSYRLDFYGSGTSSFLHRSGTDRLWLSWDLASPRVVERLAAEATRSESSGAPMLVRAAADGSPEQLDFEPALAAHRALIEVPDDFNACSREQPERALRWRELTRRAFRSAFEAGFRVEDFERGASGGRAAGTYVLNRAGAGARSASRATLRSQTGAELRDEPSGPTLELERIELRELRMPLKATFETSFGPTSIRRVLLVRAIDRSGAFGYGECTAPGEPFYNPETIDTAWYVTTQFIGPLLAKSSPGRAVEVGAALAPIREHRMAKGGVETAIWDLEAKLAGLPLWRHLGGTRSTIDCGVSIGLQPSLDALLEKVALELGRGYKRIKIKIAPGRDLELVEAVRARHPAIALSVDANSAYSLERDLELLRRLDRHGLLMIEQPLAAGDLVEHAKLQRELRTPICLDESVVDLASARHARELGSCRILNIKLGRVGGHAEARAIQKLALAEGLPAWCGGMLESGVGRAHNIAMSTLPGFTMPGDISASARYFAEEIIDPPVEVSSEGTITAPTAPGIGYRVDEARLDSLTVRREEIVL